MLAPAATAIRAYIEANYTALPIRWQNEGWGDDNPQDAGEPFIEIEIIGGRNSIQSFSSPGNRLFIHPGIVRFYIFSPWNAGMIAAMATSDALAAFMERKEFGQATGQTIRTLDFSCYDDVASEESGNYTVLLSSVGFEYYYTN